MCAFNKNLSLSWDQKLEIKTPNHTNVYLVLMLALVQPWVPPNYVEWNLKYSTPVQGIWKYSTLQIKLSNFLNYRISQYSNFQYNNMQSFMQYFPHVTWYSSSLYVGSFDTDYIICRNVENFKHLFFLQRFIFYFLFLGEGKYWIFRNILVLELKISKLINYSTNMCWRSCQGIMLLSELWPIRNAANAGCLVELWSVLV